MKDSFNDLSFSELLARRNELQKEYQNARFNKVVGHIDNPLQLSYPKTRIGWMRWW